MNRRTFCLLLANGAAAVAVSGCQSLGDIVTKDPIGVLQSAGRIGKATVAASQDITVDQERYLGRSVSARLLTRYRLLNNPQMHKYVNMVGTTVGMVSDRPDLTYHFGILDTDEVNAFAAPGGYIFITRGMIQRMDDEEQLAGILAHEVGHASAKHSLKTIKSDLWKRVAVITAQETARHQGVNPELLGLFNQATDKIVGALVTVGYSQPMEFEADRLGQLYSARAGYDPNALRRYIDQMAERERKNEGALSARLSTHPSFAARLNSLPASSGSAPASDAVQLRQSRFRQYTT